MPHRVTELFDKLRENIGLSVRIFAGIVVLMGISPVREKVNAASVPSQFNVQAQTACEAEMLREMGAREVSEKPHSIRVLAKTNYLFVWDTEPYMCPAEVNILRG